MLKKTIIILYIMLLTVAIIVLNASNYQEQYIYNKVYSPNNLALNTNSILGVYQYHGNTNYSVQYILNKIFNPSKNALNILLDTTAFDSFSVKNSDTAMVLRTNKTTPFIGIYQSLLGYDTTSFEADSVTPAYVDEFDSIDTNVWNIVTGNGGYAVAQDGALHLYSNNDVFNHDSVHIEKSLLSNDCVVKIIIRNRSGDMMTNDNFYFGFTDLINYDKLWASHFIAGGHGNPDEYIIYIYNKDGSLYDSYSSNNMNVDTITVEKYKDMYNVFIGDSLCYKGHNRGDYSYFYCRGKGQVGDLYIESYEEDSINTIKNVTAEPIYSPVYFNWNNNLGKNVLMYYDSTGVYIDSAKSHIGYSIYADTSAYSNYADNSSWHNVRNSFSDTALYGNVLNIYKPYLGQDDSIVVSYWTDVVNIYASHIQTKIVDDWVLGDSKPLVINFFNNTINRDASKRDTAFDNYLYVNTVRREVVINNYHGALNINTSRSAEINNCYLYNSRTGTFTNYALNLYGGSTSHKRYEINNCHIESDSTNLGFSGALFLNGLDYSTVDIKNCYIYNHGVDSSEGSAIMVRGSDNDTINIYNSHLLSEADGLNGVIDGGFSINTQVNVYNSSLLAKDNLLGQLGVMADWGLDVNLYNSYIEAPSGVWTYRVYNDTQYSHIKLDGCNVVVDRYALRPSYGKLEAYNSTFISTKDATDNDTGIVWITPAGDNSNLGGNFYDSLIINNCKFISNGVLPILFSQATNDDQAHDSICNKVYIDIQNSQFISNRDTLINTSTYSRDSFNIVLDNIKTNTSAYMDGSYSKLTVSNDTIDYTNPIKIGMSSTYIGDGVINTDTVNAELLNATVIDSGRMNYIEMNPNRNSVSQSIIKYNYSATIDNFNTLDTTEWILTSPATIQSGDLILLGNGGGIVSKSSSGDASGGTWKWEFSHLKLSDGHNYARFGFTSDNSVSHTERVVQIDGYKTVKIFNGATPVWQNTYTNADDIQSILIKKIASDSCQVYVNDTLRKIVYYNFTTYKYPSIYATQLNYSSSNDSILVNSYIHGSLYSNATLSYDYNNNTFNFMLDSDTIFTALKGKIDVDTVACKVIHNNTSTPLTFKSGDVVGDSIISIFYGQNNDTVFTVDSFNKIRVYHPVVTPKCGAFLYRDSTNDKIHLETADVWQTLAGWSVVDTTDCVILGDSAIVVTDSGLYSVFLSLSLKAITTGDNFDIGISKNDSIPPVWLRARAKPQSTYQTISFESEVRLGALDTLKVKIVDLEDTNSVRCVYGQFSARIK